MPNFTVQHMPEHWKSATPNQQTGQLPPFEVLLNWLAYVHSQTGEWPLPPLEEKEKPKEKVEVSNTAKLRLIQPTSQTSNKVTNFETGFSYVNSQYFNEACRIIDTYTTQPLDNQLTFGCKLTLSLVLAWCHYPLFNLLHGRQGRWMILATQHCTRELHIRTDTFKDYITELEKVGILSTGSAGDEQFLSNYEFEQLKEDCSQTEALLGSEAANFWNKRTVQTKTTIYSLNPNIELVVKLPVFEPFAKVEKVNNAETGKTYQTKVAERLEKPHVVNPLNKKSFPVSSCYELINHDDDKLAENLDSGYLPEMTDAQKTCFDFLDKQAHFEGYARSDGRTTLDTQQVLKIVLNKNLSLETLQTRYLQVKEMWSTGQCRKNPLGLLYWAITNDQDPRGDALDSKTPQILATPSKKLAKPTSVRNFKKQAILGISQEKLRKWSQLQPTATVPVLDELPLLSATDLPEVWREIRQIDLAGRFRLAAEQLALLENSQLEYSNQGMPITQQIRLLLRSAIDEYQLNASTRQLIQLVVRQKVSPNCEVIFGH